MPLLLLLLLMWLLLHKAKRRRICCTIYQKFGKVTVMQAAAYLTPNACPHIPDCCCRAVWVPSQASAAGPIVMEDKRILQKH